MYINIWENMWNQHVFSIRLNFEKELKSTVWGREFQQFITRSLKKLARTQFVVWRLKSFTCHLRCVIHCVGCVKKRLISVKKEPRKKKEKEYGVFWDTVYMWLRLCVAVYVPPSMSRCVIHCVSKNVSVKNEPRKKKRKTEVFSEAQCTCGWHCV